MRECIAHVVSSDNPYDKHQISHVIALDTPYGNLWQHTVTYDDNKHSVITLTYV